MQQNIHVSYHRVYVVSYHETFHKANHEVYVNSSHSEDTIKILRPIDHAKT